MLSIKYKRVYFIFISILIFIGDQLTKYIVSIDLKSLINKNLIIFSIEYVKNYGAAFNILEGNRIFLYIVSISISILILYIIINNNNLGKIDLYSYSLILGGTIGNGFDRISKGYVIDFINLNYINFPVFNIADISINVGLILILYSFIKLKK